MLRHVPQRDAQTLPLLTKAENIPLPSGWADMVICFSAFPHVADKKAAVAEFFRILKPGGLAYVLHIDGRAKLNALHDGHRAVCGDHLPCPHGMGLLFSEVGFNVLQAHESEVHYHFCAQKPESYTP